MAEHYNHDKRGMKYAVYCSRTARRTLKNAPALSKEGERSFSEVFTDHISEQLPVYFVFTYFCGAVYNTAAGQRRGLRAGEAFYAVLEILSQTHMRILPS